MKYKNLAKYGLVCYISNLQSPIFNLKAVIFIYIFNIHQKIYKKSLYECMYF